MFLTILDLILILALFGFVAMGFAMGLIQTVGAVVGVFAGAWLASLFYEGFASVLTPILLGHAGLAKVVSFILIFTIANRLVGLLFYILGKVFNLLAIIPFLKTFNRLFGAIFGLIEGVLVLGFTLTFILNLAISPWFDSAMAGSEIAKLLVMAVIFIPLTPEIINHLNVKL
jgi:uncharacterized membrane protein required for colicin V production